MAKESLAHITVAVLAGGLGTRLRAVTGDAQKVLAQVQGRPFLCRLLDQLQAAGARDVVLCTGHRSDLVSACLGESYGPLSLRYSVESERLGTAGALRLALEQCQGDELLALNGDSYLQADLPEFLRRHRESGARASLLLARVEDVARYGAVSTDPAQRITGFLEKGGACGPGWINGGIYLLRRSVLQAIPAGREVSLERELFPALIGSDFFGFQGGRFIDIGTPESYREAANFFGSIDTGQMLPEEARP